MNFAADPTVRRLGWALVHSLWEGALVAMLLVTALAALRRARATTRYAASLIALGSLAALPLVNYVVVPSLHRHVGLARASTGPAPAPTNPSTAVAPPVTAGSSLPFAADNSSAREAMTAPGAFRIPEVDPLLPWIVAAWALGVAAVSAWHVGGWYRVWRLRRAGTRPMDERWDAAIARLGKTLRVARPVRLLESALVQVPTVIGWLRPVVLVPASAVSGLTARQLEAILAHELAHVRRHDYLVNVAQAVVETVLFYHPAVWWVSGRVRAEREHCCDDDASRAVGDAVFYARALAAMEELRSAASCAQSPALALAADGRAGHGSLLGRIHRLVGAGAGRRTVVVGPWSAAVGVAMIALPLLPVVADVAGDRLQMPATPIPAEEKAPAEARAELTVDDIGRLDSAMAQKLQRRDELRTELTRLRTTMPPNHPAVIRLQNEVQLIEQAIANAAGDSRGNWVLNNAVPVAADDTKPQAPARPDGEASQQAPKVGERNYFISGVPRPGAYALGKRPVNLLQALIAGGLDVDASRGRQVVLLRRQEGVEGLKENAREAVITLTVGDLLDRREKDTFLRPDDIIMLKAAPEAGRGGNGADAALIEPPPGLWRRAAAYLQEVGVKDLDHVTVISAYADTAAGEAFVAIRKPGVKEEDSAYPLRMHFKGGAWDVERPTSDGPLSAAGIGLARFQKEFPNARRFAEPLSVAPLKAESKTE